MATRAADRQSGRNQIGFRVSDSMRQALELAASKAGRSLSQEVEARISQTFADQSVLAEIFGGEAAAAACMMFSRVVKECQGETGKTISDDIPTLAAAVIGWSRIVGLFARECGVVKDDEIASVQLVGGRAAEAAVRLTHPSMYSEHFPNGMPDPRDTQFENLVFSDDDHSSTSVLRRRNRPFKTKN